MTADENAAWCRNRKIKSRQRQNEVMHFDTHSRMGICAAEKVTKREGGMEATEVTRQRESRDDKDKSR